MTRPALLLAPTTLISPVADPADTASRPQATGTTTLEEMVIQGKAEDLLGIAPSATKGQASQEELMDRPLLRRGELLEAVPGVVITQHSGGGKANQYFLRGFNLDHGTDFGVFLDDMQVNFRTYAHGQGYADLNFIIPELIGGMDYRKGPYFADLGDLSSAGEANYHLVNRLEQGTASITLSENDYSRAFAGDSIELGAGTLTLGAEYSREDGPWETGDNYRRINGVAKYFQGTDRDFFSITGMYYDGRWNASDQVARRAIREGTVGRFGLMKAPTPHAAVCNSTASGRTATPQHSLAPMPATMISIFSRISPTSSTIRSAATNSNSRTSAGFRA